MEDSKAGFRHLATLFERTARRMLAIGANRLDLLAAEVQEERERLLRAICLALGVAVLGLLAGITLTASIVVCVWGRSPLAVLVSLTLVYGAAAAVLLRRLTACLRDWQTFPDSLDQLRKDRSGLEKLLP
jgi:uncharacterized membrane protein YqjE